jgi:Zn-dependent peptidase ImmA (M78 family)
MYRERPGCCWVLAALETLAMDYLRKGGIHGPPVPSEAITLFDQSRRIELRLVPLKFHHGASWLVGKEWVIHLNARDSSAVRRLTIFHEAFHIACRNANPAFKRFDLEARPFREILADHFATCFLMPKEWVEEQWLKVHDVRKMARIFDVSKRAMKRRLRQLGLLEETTNFS